MKMAWRVIHIPNVYRYSVNKRSLEIYDDATMISGRFDLKKISYRYFCSWNSEFFNPPVYACSKKIVRQINFISLRFLFPFFQKYLHSLKLKKKKKKYE